MARFHGLSVQWGVNSTLIGVNGAFQTREHQYKCDNELIKNGGNTSVSKLYYDFSERASFVYVAVQAGLSQLGNAHVDTPFLGQWVNIVDTRYPAIAGQWLVDDISISSSNTSATRVTLDLSRYPFVLKI